MCAGLLRSLAAVFHPLVVALGKGVGVHHSSLPFKYRSAVERFYRAGELLVCFSTQTLAVGINMPCRTTAFVQDSTFLNPLSFRQMSGRAGRRGFDTFGHVVFVGLPKPKVATLLSSEVTHIAGDPFIFDTTTVGKLFKLWAQSGMTKSSADNAADRNAVRQAVESLQQPLAVYVGSESGDTAKNVPAQMATFAVFTMNLLVSLGLMAPNGTPVGMMNLAMHIGWDVPGNLVLCYMLQQGLIHKLIKQAGSVEAATPQLCALLAFLFTDEPAVAGAAPLALPAAYLGKSIDEYETIVLGLLSDVPKTLASYRAQPALPLSKSSMARAGAANVGALGKMTFQNDLYSPFMALSGAGQSQRLPDSRALEFSDDSIVFDASVAPLWPARRTTTRLNTFAVDFMQHGEIKLVIESGVPEAIAYDRVRGFSTLLRSIADSLTKMARPVTQAADEVTGEGGITDPVVEAFNALAGAYSEKLSSSVW